MFELTLKEDSPVDIYQYHVTIVQAKKITVKDNLDPATGRPMSHYEILVPRENSRRKEVVDIDRAALLCRRIVNMLEKTYFPNKGVLSHNGEPFDFSGVCACCVSLYLTSGKFLTC